MKIPKSIVRPLSIATKTAQPINESGIKPLLTVPEVSQWLRVQESTIRKWVCYNRIPYLKIGTSVAFSKDQIEAWLKKNNPSYERWGGENKVEKSYNTARAVGLAERRHHVSQTTTKW